MWRKFTRGSYVCHVSRLLALLRIYWYINIDKFEPRNRVDVRISLFGYAGKFFCTRQKETNFDCENYNVDLRAVPCFEMYRTVINDQLRITCLH